MNWLVALAAVPSFLIAWAIAGVLCRLAPKWGFVDRPGDRKIHKSPVAFGGGLAIWAGVVAPFAAAEWLLVAWSRVYRDDPSAAQLDFSFAGEWASRLAEFIEPHLPGLLARSSDLWFFLACGTVLVALGLVDDTRNLDWRFRLAVEFLVAAAVVFGRGWKLTLFVDWPVLTDVVSVLWIVGLINSFNMLDNMDGLSAGVAAIAADDAGQRHVAHARAGLRRAAVVHRWSAVRAGGRFAGVSRSQSTSGANRDGGRRRVFHWFFAGRDDDSGYFLGQWDAAARDPRPAVCISRADL